MVYFDISQLFIDLLQISFSFSSTATPFQLFYYYYLIFFIFYYYFFYFCYFFINKFFINIMHNFSGL